jgi:hypothetical protein
MPEEKTEIEFQESVRSKMEFWNQPRRAEMTAGLAEYQYIGRGVTQAIDF